MESARKNCESPMKLENLLEIPLKVVRLEDLLREKDSSNSNEPTTSISTSEGRICRSASSSPRQRLDEGRPLPRSSSTPCLFECCAKPSRWRETEQFSNKTRFKATSIRFPDGTTAVIPVMDLDFNYNSNKEDQKEEEADNNNCERRIEEQNYDDQTNLVERDEKRGEMESGLTSTESSGIVVGSGSGTSLVGSAGSGCKLLKVLDKPMRFQDLLEQDAIRNLHHSVSGRPTAAAATAGLVVGDNAITARGDHDRARDPVHQEIKDQKGFVSADEDDTLKLTFYSDGRKESEKEFRMRCVDSISPSGGEIIACGGGGTGTSDVDVRSYQTAQGLQMTRVFCENENNNTSNTQAGRVSTIMRAGAAKEPDSLWEDCGDGLQILRCERRERTRERKNATPAPAYYRYAGENGESAPSSLMQRCIKQEENTGKDEQMVTGATIQLASSPTRMPGLKDGVEDWSEQRILRVPTRPYLRKRITYEQPRQPTPEQSAAPVPVATQMQETSMNLAKRYKPALPPVPPFDGGQQQQHQQPRFSEVAGAGTTSHGVPHSQPQPFPQQEPFRRPQVQTANLIPPPQVSPHQNNMIRPTQMSPQQSQNYSRAPPRNIPLEESVVIAAEAASSQEAPFNSASYYDWLRRYWDIYQRQGIDWQRIAEYYERYHFYPWDIPRAKEERPTGQPQPRRRKTPIPMLPDTEAYGQQEHLQQQQQQQHLDYSIQRSSSGSITKGIPIPTTSYVDGRIQQFMMSQSPQPPQQQSSSQAHHYQQQQRQYHSSSQQMQMQSHPLNFQTPTQGYGQQQHQHHHQRQEYQAYHHQQQQQSQPQVRQYFPRNKRPDAYPNEFQNPSLFAQAYNQVAVAAAAAAVASTTKEDQTRLNSNLASVLISNVNNNSNSTTAGGQYHYQQQQRSSYNYQQQSQNLQQSSNMHVAAPGNGRLGPRNMYSGSHYGNNGGGNYGQGSHTPLNTGSASGQSVFRHANEWSIRQSEGSLDISSYPQPIQQRSVIRRLSSATAGGDVVAVATAVKPQFPPQQYGSNAY